MTPTMATIVTEGFHLIKDLSYVALFAYITHEAFTYASARLSVYGQAGDLFPPAPTPDTDEPEWYRKGNTIGPVGFHVTTEGVSTPVEETR